MKQLEILIKRADSFYKKLPKIGGSEDSWNAAGTQVDFKSTPEELQRYVATQMPRSSVQPAAGNEAAPVSAGGLPQVFQTGTGGSHTTRGWVMIRRYPT